MSIFDFFHRQKASGSSLLRRSVQCYLNAPSPAGLRTIYGQLPGSTLVITLNQQASGVKNGALVTPRSGGRLEFATSVNRESNMRVVPVFTDLDSFNACFSAGAVPKQGTSIPHILMHAHDLLPILAASGLGMELRVDRGAIYIDAETVKKLAAGGRA